MPLPLIIGAGLAAAGIGGSIHGAAKTKKAKKTMKSAESHHKKNIELLEKRADATTKTIETLEENELKIFSEFGEFADLINKIKNQPEFKIYDNDKSEAIISEREAGDLKEISDDVESLIASVGESSQSLIATQGAKGVTAMIGGMAPIMSLGGNAAKLIGGGTLVARGGAIAGGAILGPATLGASFLVGGVISSLTASKLSSQADEAWGQVRESEEKFNKIYDYLEMLDITSSRYQKEILKVKKIYDEHVIELSQLILERGKTNWNEFSSEEKLTTENAVLLTGLLYSMCKIELVIPAENQEDENIVNVEAVDKSIADANSFVKEREL